MNKLSRELRSLITPTDRILKLIWMGQFVPLGIYTFIAFQTPNAAKNMPHKPLVLVFVAVALASMVFSLLLRSAILSASGVARVLNDKMPFWYYSVFRSQMSESKRELSKNLNETEQKLFDYASRIFNLQLMLWGLLNSTAIFGLILALMSRQGKIVLYFVIPVALVLLTQLPDIGKLLEAGLAEKATGSGSSRGKISR